MQDKMIHIHSKSILNFYYCVNMASCDVALHTKQLNST